MDPVFAEKQREYQRAHCERNPEAVQAKQRAAYLRRTYGITEDQYQELLVAQGGRCAICGGLPQGGTRDALFAIDHDHETGGVRGLLCDLCNRGLGHFDDEPALLGKAVSYLQTYHQAALKDPGIPTVTSMLRCN